MKYKILAVAFMTILSGCSSPEQIEVTTEGKVLICSEIDSNYVECNWE